MGIYWDISGSKYMFDGWLVPVITRSPFRI